MHRFRFLSLLCLIAAPATAITLPGPAYAPPAMPTAAGAPQVYEFSPDAGPDETFFLVGDHLSQDVTAWGDSADSPGGQAWKPKVQFLKGNYLAATLPDSAPDGPFLVWIKNEAGYSAPIVLNAPQPWWVSPDRAAPGETVRLFGRNLSRRPDEARAFVHIAPATGEGAWAEVTRTGKYEVDFRVPTGLTPGDYSVRVHAGVGGEWGWGFTLHLSVGPAAPTRPERKLQSTSSTAPIQQALDAVAGKGVTVRLPAGTFQFSGTLRIPAGVTLAGAGRDRTILQSVADPAVHFTWLPAGGWNRSPQRVQTAGDKIEYELEVPQTGEWTVWLRYATDMAPYGRPGMSGSTSLAVDGGLPVPLQNLPNTGGWGAYQWAKTASLHLPAGRRRLVWTNNQGGGISMDAFVFALDPQFVPGNSPFPVSGPSVQVLQAEDYVRMDSKEGEGPGGDRAAVWLQGNGAAIEDLSVLGSAATNFGIAIQAGHRAEWIDGCRVEQVRVADVDGKRNQNSAVYVHDASHATIRNNELWGRAPLVIAGARQGDFSNNRLVSVTRFGGNAEAAILGQNDTVDQCIVEGNVIASPPGAAAGGPTARRLLWFSTGHGSVSHNYIAHNGVEKPLTPGAEPGAGQARFGGVAGTDQNVGEMILFEGNHRTAYFGPLAGAGPDSVTLPRTIPATPDDRLGSVKRSELAHDAAGNETPFWPPDRDDATEEPPIDQYMVSIFSGVGQGQTRRVIRREGERLVLEHPWRVQPQAGWVVAVGTGFYQNLIVENNVPDGMTGVQLWISCVENVISGNTISRQRKQGLYLYANGTTLASSMPRTWNRGISPLFWNMVEGNRADECSAGVLVTSGDESRLPVEFPRALGNTVRHNSFIRNRSDGVILSAHIPAAGVQDSSASIVGTMVEFNVVRDAVNGYHAASSSDDTVFRRDHAYFWYPVNNSSDAPVGFLIDNPDSTAILDVNSIEGKQGVNGDGVIDVKRGGTAGKG